MVRTTGAAKWPDPPFGGGEEYLGLWRKDQVMSDEGFRPGLTVLRLCGPRITRQTLTSQLICGNSLTPPAFFAGSTAMSILGNLPRGEPFRSPALAGSRLALLAASSRAALCAVLIC